MASSGSSGLAPPPPPPPPGGGQHPTLRDGLDPTGGHDDQDDHDDDDDWDAEDPNCDVDLRLCQQCGYQTYLRKGHCVNRQCVASLIA